MKHIILPLAIVCAPVIACNKSSDAIPDEYLEFAPEWANWAAVNPRNELCYYEARPRMHHSLKGWDNEHMGVVRCVEYPHIPEFWESTLVKIKRD